jgi:hypothetical protein
MADPPLDDNRNASTPRRCAVPILRAIARRGAVWGPID